MFAEVELEWTVVVQPDAMKSNVHVTRAIILALVKDFNDIKCTATHGYHVSLTTLEEIGENRLWERRGCAAYPVRFRCMVFTLERNEHVFAVVTEAQPSGIMCHCGPIEHLFISKVDPQKEAPKRGKKPKTDHMPGYEFVDTAKDEEIVPYWFKESSGTYVRKGDVLRVRILATKWEPATRSLSALGSLIGHYGGVDERYPEPADAAAKSGFEDGSPGPNKATGWGAGEGGEDGDFGGGAQTNGDGDEAPEWD